MQGDFSSVRGLLKGLAIVAVALLALAAASGCGGGSSSSTSTSAEVSTPGETTEETASNGSPESEGESESSTGGLPGESSESLSSKPSGGSSGSSGSPSGGGSSGSGNRSGGKKGGKSRSKGGKNGGKGGSGGGGGGQSASTPKAEFIKQADAVCQKTRLQLGRDVVAFQENLNKNPPKPTAPRPEIAAAKTVFVPNFQRQVDGIRALHVPPGDEAQIEAFLKALQEVIDEANSKPVEFFEAGLPFGEAPKLAKAYGLTGCAEFPK